MASGIYIRTDEAKRNMSKAHLGQVAWNTGKTLTPAHIEKLRLAKLGKKRAGNPENWKHTEETRQKQSDSRKGKVSWNKGKTGYKTKPCSEERRQNISKAKKGKAMPWVVGENNHNWKGGITPINTKIRNSTEYKNWRVSVFERDNYTCQECGSRGVELHADHIKPFAFHPELRLVMSNGRTLCVPCHKATDTYLWKAKSKEKISCQP